MVKSQNNKDKTPKLVDHVSDSSDEEIDEDLAFNSDDERQYGALLNRKGKSSSSSSKLSPSESDDDGSDDDVSDDDDNDDSDSSEQSYDDDDDSDGIASDDDDQDGDGGQYMLDLLNSLDANKDAVKKQAKEDAKKALAHTTMIKESEYSTVVKGTELTLDELMFSIADTKGFGNVQKAMKDIMTSDSVGHGDANKRQLSTTKAPVAKVISDRAQRKVAYEENVNEVSQWITAVKRNREAETLDFRPEDRIKISKDELVVKFEPTTEFEKEMAAALEEAGATDEKEIMKQERHNVLLGLVEHGDDDDDDLGRNQLSAEEYKKRKGELAKLRALMFYEEQKRYHMNKIKSKKYRKIRKKQRMRLKDSEDAEAAEQDEEYARELEEKAEMERMKERMSLKHRNTSKWAKRVLRRGANVDADTRRALSEQVRIGDELKKKMTGQYSDDDDDDDDDSNLLDQAKAILADMEQNDGNETNKGLFKLDFMKRGLEAQRERAKQEARELLRELESHENMANSDDEEQEHNFNNEEEEGDVNGTREKRKKVATSKEMEQVLPKGKLVAKSLEFGNSNAVSVSGAIDLDVEGDDTVTRRSSTSESAAIDVTLSKVESLVDDREKNKGDQVVVSKEPIRAAVANCYIQRENESDNPWMRNNLNGKNTAVDIADGQQGKRKKTLPSITKEGIINVADVINVITGNDDEEQQKKGNSEAAINVQSSSAQDGNKVVANDVKIASMSQQDLVRQAFATVSEKDIQDEFDNEKNTMRERDDHSKKVKTESTKVSGWGSWTGEGVPPPRPPKQFPKHLQPPEKKIPKRRREDDGKKNVIINAKRIKKTAKFQIENIPYPFSSREQYERAIAGAMGGEWNVSGAVKDMTRPEVIT
eukprot:CAMPEP_0176499018 /NCGR_PEP_ID=MMETSP0200_2-20121128/12675_1 /TAXON_ID=947934 /ORGANISM="Chaetoceros sp., Strain GSL56" /LENGTH=877 /DNA_ID=CAMNT_0017897353 /DNA_START=51 /DNA_END=2680 /DNA_ORIENTATION=-